MAIPAATLTACSPMRGHSNRPVAFHRNQKLVFSSLERTQCRLATLPGYSKRNSLGSIGGLPEVGEYLSWRILQRRWFSSDHFKNPLSHKGEICLQVLAAQKKKQPEKEVPTNSKEHRLEVPVRPTSLFAKKSPVPRRKALRPVPDLDGIVALSVDGPDLEVLSKGSSNSKAPKRMEKRSFPRDAKQVEDVAANAKDESNRHRGKHEKVSKWASLFEAAANNPIQPSSTQGRDADGWFDKIFPKTITQAKDELGSPNLSAQQEKSIQQLQTLVKTLGMVTKNLPPPQHRNRHNIGQQLPAQNEVDPVPFSTILKRLQEANLQDIDKQDDVKESNEVATGGAISLSREDETESGIELSPNMSTSVKASTQASIDRNIIDPSSAPNEQPDLSAFTILQLKEIAKSRGLKGYTKMKKAELIECLKSSGS